MKQTILYTDTRALSPFNDVCLGRVVVRWAFFGVLMWWLSTALGFHAIAWPIGLVLAFAMVRNEFGV